MDVYEELEIYRATKTDNDKLLNDKLIYKHNCLFEIYLNSWLVDKSHCTSKQCLGA